MTEEQTAFFKEWVDLMARMQPRLQAYVDGLREFASSAPPLDRAGPRPPR